MDQPTLQRGELGYRIGEPFWGQGLATDAARALVRFAFEQLGMTREGLHRERYLKGGRFEDVVECAVLRGDWALGSTTQTSAPRTPQSISIMDHFIGMRKQLQLAGDAMRAMLMIAGATSVLLACADAAAPADDTSVEIAEALYADRRIELLQPTLLRCSEESASLLCGESTIDEVVPTGLNLFTFSERQVWLSVDEEAPRLLARDGSGPGELRAPIAFGSDGDGRLMAYDIARMRLLSIGAEEPSSEIEVFPPPYLRAPRIRAGGLYALTLPPGAEPGELVQASVLRYSVTTSSWSDTVAVFTEPAKSTRGNTEAFLSSMPWDRKTLWDACDDGRVVLAHSDQWLVEWYGADSAPSSASGRVSRPGAARQAMTAGEHERLIAEQPVRESSDPRLAVRPPYRQVLDAVFCGTDGAAVLVNAPDFGDSLRTIDVVVDDGVLLRSVRIPSSFVILDVYGDTVFGVVRGEDLSERFGRVSIGRE